MNYSIKKTISLLALDRYVCAAKHVLMTHLRSSDAAPGASDLARGVVRVMRREKFVDFRRGREAVLQYAAQMRRIFKKMSFGLSGEYFYPLDEKLHRVIAFHRSEVVSLTPDYGEVLRLSRSRVLGLLDGQDSPFARSIRGLLDSIEILQERSVCYLTDVGTPRALKLKEYVGRLLGGEPASLDEALQKLLFFNALLWQAGHRHNGLGRLDKILWPYYKADVDAGRLTRDGARQLLKSFVVVLGANMHYKSGNLAGDTGQVILIGGQALEGGEVVQVENELTHLFLEVITELNVPDPKLILRVNEHTSERLWREAIACMSRGNGSPLLAGEERIMASMAQFGYDPKDCYEFGTSACWEPLIIGKSFDQNNSCENIVPMHSLAALLNEGGEWATFEDLVAAYENRLQREVARIASFNAVKPFDVSPLMSLYRPECLEKGADISLGGAKYYHHGYLVCGLPNVVDSLLNLREMVFERRALSIDRVRALLASDFEGEPDLPAMLKALPHRFGENSELTRGLTNRLMKVVSDEIDRHTINGERVKVGFSSPSYVSAGRGLGASFDGRRAGEPLNVHISTVSREIDMAEVLAFAGGLDYSGSRINGNVVDLVVPHVYVAAPEKFAEILRGAFRAGVYELQTNVFDVEKLVAARRDPSLYPQLVVRVWGFSAYFNDLPDEYKDMLIERARRHA